MPDNDNNQPVNVDARKLALEAMAALVNVKRIAAVDCCDRRAFPMV